MDGDDSFSFNDIDANAKDDDNSLISSNGAATQNEANRESPEQVNNDNLQESWGEVEQAIGYRLADDRKMKFDEFIKNIQEDEVETLVAPPHDQLELPELSSHYSFHPIDSRDEDLSCLHVESAELSCPKIDLISQDHALNANDSKLKRIFHLGLVLFELFSGSQVLPSPKLCALVFSDGAFVSLQPLSLEEGADSDGLPESQRAIKRRSIQDDENELCHSVCNELELMGIPHQLCRVS